MTDALPSVIVTTGRQIMNEADDFLLGNESPTPSDDEQDGPKKSQATELVEMALDRFNLGVTDSGEAYAIVDGVDAIGPVPADRWDNDALYAPSPQPGRV